MKNGFVPPLVVSGGDVTPGVEPSCIMRLNGLVLALSTGGEAAAGGLIVGGGVTGAGGGAAGEVQEQKQGVLEVQVPEEQEQEARPEAVT